MALLVGMVSVGTALADPPVPANPDAQRALAAVRKATARYHNVGNALAAGYVSTVECVEVPGLGVMGIHYVNFFLFDPFMNEWTPEVLLYVNTEGGPRLVGVEYAAVALANLVVDDVVVGGIPWFGASEPPDGWFTTAPTVFGETMDGPMEGHEGGPRHYELHVWLWQANPAGIFAEFNPLLKCE